MTAEIKHNYLLPHQGLHGNKEDTRIELSWLEDFGLKRKQILDWYCHSNEQAIQESLKMTSSSPHTFAAGGLSFDVFYHNETSKMQLIVKLQRRVLLIRMRLSQLLFPSSFILRDRCS